jgi:hypothetical protein
MTVDDWPQVERRLVKWFPPLRGNAAHDRDAYLAALDDVPVETVLAALKARLSIPRCPTPSEIVAYGPTAPYVAEGIRAIIEAALGFPDSEKAP